MTVESELESPPPTPPTPSPAPLSLFHPLPAFFFSSLRAPPPISTSLTLPSPFLLLISCSPLPSPPSVPPQPPCCCSSKPNLRSLSRRVLRMQKAGSRRVYACVCVLFPPPSYLSNGVGLKYKWLYDECRRGGGGFSPRLPQHRIHLPYPPNLPAADAIVVCALLSADSSIQISLMGSVSFF